MHQALATEVELTIRGHVVPSFSIRIIITNNHTLTITTTTIQHFFPNFLPSFKQLPNKSFKMFFKTAIFSAVSLLAVNGAMAAALPAEDGEVSIMIATDACKSQLQAQLPLL